MTTIFKANEDEENSIWTIVCYRLYRLHLDIATREDHLRYFLFDQSLKYFELYVPNWKPTLDCCCLSRTIVTWTCCINTSRLMYRISEESSLLPKHNAVVVLLLSIDIETMESIVVCRHTEKHSIHSRLGIAVNVVEHWYFLAWIRLHQQTKLAHTDRFGRMQCF